MLTMSTRIAQDVLQFLIVTISIAVFNFLTQLLANISSDRNVMAVAEQTCIIT